MSRIRSGYFTTDCGFGFCKPPYYVVVEVCKNCVYRFFKLRLWGALQLEIMPPNRTKNTQMLAVICPVCEKRIVDASANTTVEDSIMCEGLCNAWLHRKCASMSKATFEATQLSSDSFLCPHCCLDAQQHVIHSLKESVSHLLSRVAELETKLGLSQQKISGGTPVDTSVDDVSASAGVRGHIWPLMLLLVITGVLQQRCLPYKMSVDSTLLYVEWRSFPVERKE